MIKERKLLITNGFILKIIAMFFMTLDHVGIFLLNIENTQQIGNIFRIFGRLALPIFIFLIAEGVRHTKNFGKYITRLSILAAVFMIGQIIFYYFINNGVSNFYSPILDLVLVATTLYLLKRKDKFSLLAILPIAYIVLCFTISIIEKSQSMTVYWLPFYLRMPYPLFDILLGLGFYYSREIATIFLKSSENTVNLIGTKYERYATNLVSTITVIFVPLIFYVIYITSSYVDYMDSIQVFTAFAFIPLVLYSGERGYNKNWFKYSCYLYVPLHLLIIYLIFSLI